MKFNVSSSWDNFVVLPLNGATEMMMLDNDCKLQPTVINMFSLR